MVVARAILDERLIDLPLSPLFWDLALENPVHLEDLRRVDRQLAQTMLGFQELLNRRREIENDRRTSGAQKRELLERLSYKVLPSSSSSLTSPQGASIEALGINFTLPGAENILLVPSGSQKTLSLDCLAEYLEAFGLKFFRDAIRLQVEAFRDGFNKVPRPTSPNPTPARSSASATSAASRPRRSRRSTAAACATSTGRRRSCSRTWSRPTATRARGQFFACGGTLNLDSPSFLSFVEVLSEFNEEERKSFLKFVTGCPRLPKGGTNIPGGR